MSPRDQNTSRRYLSDTLLPGIKLQYVTRPLTILTHPFEVVDQDSIVCDTNFEET